MSEFVCNDSFCKLDSNLRMIDHDQRVGKVYIFEKASSLTFHRGPVKLILRVKIACLFIRLTSRLFQFTILSLFW